SNQSLLTVFTSTLFSSLNIHNCLGKSVIAKVKIPKATVLSLDMFAVKVGEPKGIPPEHMQQLVGKKIKVDVEEDDSHRPFMRKYSHYQPCPN
uniref:Ice-structuring protein n=1 Tax=Pundamilia nyererei TaxID=303518 RepID=A0A3B4HCP7_9CICH